MLTLNLPEPLWIRAEIAQIGLSKGHRYLDLVEHDDSGETIIAQSAAVLWERQYRSLRRKLGAELAALLQEGTEVLVHARLDFHERYGLKLVIEDIDPAYTLGKLLQQRQRVVEQLRAEGLLERNRALPLPAVIQRIAVLSSPQAAGYQDFQDQLHRNHFGYRFRTQLFPAAVQGQQAEPEMIAQLERLERQADRFDVAVVIRGGGARLDLAAFDLLELNRTFAHCPLPVIAGIGHETDQSVLDLVAARSLKTPTAVADFILNHNLTFEQDLLLTGQEIRRQSELLVRATERRLDEWSHLIRLSARHTLQKEYPFLDQMVRFLEQSSGAVLRNARRQLEEYQRLNRLLSLENTLIRGFSLTEKEGRLLRSAQEARAGDSLTTYFADGKVRSIVEPENKHKDET